MWTFNRCSDEVWNKTQKRVWFVGPAIAESALYGHGLVGLILSCIWFVRQKNGDAHPFVEGVSFYIAWKMGYFFAILHAIFLMSTVTEILIKRTELALISNDTGRVIPAVFCVLRGLANMDFIEARSVGLKIQLAFNAINDVERDQILSDYPDMSVERVGELRLSFNNGEVIIATDRLVASVGKDSIVIMKDCKVLDIEHLEDLEQLKSIRGSDDLKTCTICVNDKTRFFVPTCGHVMCSECAITWAKNSNNVNCPMCRKNF
jgi:hypothetical protein